MRFLVCGDRHWSDAKFLEEKLDAHRKTLTMYGSDVRMVIHGAANGADTLAAKWAIKHSLNVQPFPALWDQEGLSAGPKRNQRMLVEGKPDWVIAFHDDIENSRGTKDMITRAKRAGVPVTLYSHKS